jgi:hypothetical protein
MLVNISYAFSLLGAEGFHLHPLDYSQATHANFTHTFYHVLWFISHISISTRLVPREFYTPLELSQACGLTCATSAYQHSQLPIHLPTPRTLELIRAPTQCTTVCVCVCVCVCVGVCEVFLLSTISACVHCMPPALPTLCHVCTHSYACI